MLTQTHWYDGTKEGTKGRGEEVGRGGRAAKVIGSPPHTTLQIGRDRNEESYLKCGSHPVDTLECLSSRPDRLKRGQCRETLKLN